MPRRAKQLTNARLRTLIGDLGSIAGTYNKLVVSGSNDQPTGSISLFGELYTTGAINLNGTRYTSFGGLTNPMSDDTKLYFGTDNDAYIEYTEATDNFLTISGSGNGIVLSGSVIQIAGTLEGASPLKIGGEVVYTATGSAAGVNLGPNKEAKLYYESGATDALTISGSSGGVHMIGSLHPQETNMYNLGSPELRWANMYTGDLHLKNNRGDWTIVEEEEYLSIINNLNGKRYKFVLEEIE